MANTQLAPRPEHAVKPPEPNIPVRRKTEFQFDALLPTVGHLELTQEERTILYAEVKDSDIEIRPNDGLIYLPWAFYAERLTRAFGPTWAILPGGKPMVQGNQILLTAYLIVKGVLVGWSAGGAEYIPNNPKLNWSDAVESALSNALSRIAGKRMGMGLKLWNKEFADRWVVENAEYATRTDPRTKRAVTGWYKKAGTKSSFVGDEPPPESEPGEIVANADYWRNHRGDLIGRISRGIPYYGKQGKHIIASLSKLAEDGQINAEMTDDAVFAVVDRHAGQQADKSA